MRRLGPHATTAMEVMQTTVRHMTAALRGPRHTILWSAKPDRARCTSSRSIVRAALVPWARRGRLCRSKPEHSVTATARRSLRVWTIGTRRGMCARFPLTGRTRIAREGTMDAALPAPHDSIQADLDRRMAVQRAAFE